MNQENQTTLSFINIEIDEVVTLDVTQLEWVGAAGGEPDWG